MSRFWVKTSLIAFAICLPILFSTSARAQSTQLILTADGAIAEASNAPGSPYPLSDTVQGQTLYWDNIPDGLTGYIQYFGPAATLTCEWAGGEHSWNLAGNGEENFIYIPKIGSNYVKCYASNVSVEVTYTVLPG